MAFRHDRFFGNLSRLVDADSICVVNKVSAAKQELDAARAQAAAELAAVDKATDQARSALGSVELTNLIPSQIPSGDRLDFGATPLAANRKLESSRQQAAESAEQIARESKALQVERVRQAERRQLVIILGASAAIVLMVLLAWGFINFISAQQAAAVATAIAQQAAAASTAVAQQVAPLRAQFNYQQRGNDNAEMVLVPAGEFTMGSDSGFNDEKPAHRVSLDAFWIDVFEVTNARYKKCVDAGKCQPPASSSSDDRNSYYGNSQYDNYPVIYVA